MKLKISVLSILSAVLWVFLSSNSLAYENDDYKRGLTNGPGVTLSGAEVGRMFDDNLNTETSLKSLRSVEFATPQDIRAIYLNGELDHHYIEFYNAEGKLLKSEIFGKNSDLSSGQYINFSVDNVKKVSIRHDGTSYFRGIRQIEFFLEDFPPSDVGNFRIKSMDGEGNITLSWDYYTYQRENFKEFRLYKNGVKTGSSIANSSSTATRSTYKDGDEFRLTVVNNKGLESNGVTVKAHYIPELSNVEELKAVPDYNRVNLSWTLPKSPDFKHVNIFRDTVPEEKGFFQKMFSAVSVSAADGPTKIFETNGTYFNDLTVKPETTYEYKLTSVGTDGTETDGATVQATTLEEPTPVIKDPGYEITPEGDYLYTWTSPDKGKVKVLISGNEYQTVDAADKKILIPKDKMKYKMMGEPDISLQPISEYGKEGEIHEESPFEEGMLPFEGGDLLKTSMSLMVVLGPFILLALAFLIYPKLKQVISKALEARKGRRMKK